jgi:ribosome biogenesis GTPase A
MELLRRPGYNEKSFTIRAACDYDHPQILTAEYSLSAHRAHQCPEAGLPEVAFLGRSNVGKSTLINTLLGRKKLVRTSSRPGCTRALNFFLINQLWYFVDLPGFGYAAVSKELKAGWGRLVLDYLDRRTPGRRVFLQTGVGFRARGAVSVGILLNGAKVIRSDQGR